MLKMYFPIALIVFSNIFYHIAAKATPESVNPLASVTITYLVGAVFAAVLYFVLNKDGNLPEEYKHVNWSAYLLGFAIVGLEAGAMLMYKAGWNVSIGQLIYSTILSVCLVFVGVLIYKESISLKQIIGVIVCLIGIYLIK